MIKRLPIEGYDDFSGADRALLIAVQNRYKINEIIDKIESDKTLEERQRDASTQTESPQGECDVVVGADINSVYRCSQPLPCEKHADKSLDGAYHPTSSCNRGCFMDGGHRDKPYLSQEKLDVNELCHEFGNLFHLQFASTDQSKETSKSRQKRMGEIIETLKRHIKIITT